MRSTRYSRHVLIKLPFSGQIFRKIHKIQNFIKIRLEGGELFHTDGRTDIKKLVAGFRNVANPPKNDHEK